MKKKARILSEDFIKKLAAFLVDETKMAFRKIGEAFLLSGG